MKLTVAALSLTKRVPLTISRGTSTGSDNLLISVEFDGITGIGEAAPFYLGQGGEDAVQLAARLDAWSDLLTDISPLEMQRIETILADAAGPDTAMAARAAVDMACYDWLGKRTGLPVYTLLGLERERIVPTSVTIGIDTPEVVRDRVPDLLRRCAPKVLKIKLGSPDGIDADRAMFDVVRELTPPNVGLRVDANGGWGVDNAVTMIRWLGARGVEYVEQPLPVGQEYDLPHLFANSPIPLFADESCQTAADVPKLAGCVHGVNLKLMKSGGIREGLRLIHTARAHGLMVMLGCMGESSLAISASVHLSPLADYVDLDSHLNLMPDPFQGLLWEGGTVLPSDEAGLGISLA